MEPTNKSYHVDPIQQTSIETMNGKSAVELSEQFNTQAIVIHDVDGATLKYKTTDGAEHDLALFGPTLVFMVVKDE